jgi:peptidoglycan/xylan/chitin deacetylase (PgdA/CDA1 family)
MADRDHIPQEKMPAAYLTTSWDDGHPLDGKLAEMLARYDMPATFYIPCRWARPVLAPKAIRDLASRFEIGAHTISHPDLGRSTHARALSEIVDSKRYIEDITGVSCNVFAPPRGSFRRSHLAMVREAGYTGMRTVELMNIGHPVRDSGIAVLPTTLQVYRHRPSIYIRNAAKRMRPANLLTYLAHAHRRTLEGATESLIARIAGNGGVFHLWGHSWEIEERGLWPALETILASLRASRCRLVSNGALSRLIQNEHFARPVQNPELS